MKLKNIKCLLAVCLCASALLVGCGQKTADKSEISSESAQNQSDDMQKQPLMQHRQRLSVWTHFYRQEMKTARSQNWTQMEVQSFPKMQVIWRNVHWNSTRKQMARLILRFIRWWKHGDSQHRTSRFRHRRHWINFFHSLMRETFLVTKKRERYLSA